MAEVLTFREQFDTADRGDITGYNGWVGRTAESLPVFAQAAATPSGASPAYARQEGSWLVADEVEADLRVLVDGINGTKGVTLAIGSGGADNASATIGFGVRIVETNGVWNLARVDDPRALLAAATWVVVATVFPAQDAGVAVGVVQACRVRWRETVAGIRVTAWWGTAPESEPAFDHTYQATWPTGVQASRGYMLLGCDNGGSTDEMRCLGLELSAARPADDRQTQLAEFASVDEIIGRALRKFEGRRESPSFPADRLLQLLQEAQDAVLTAIGNVAWFNRRLADVVLVADDNGRVTMPHGFADVLAIEPRGRGGHIAWRTVGHTEDGRVLVRLESLGGADATVTYTPRRERLSANGNVAVHRDIDRALVDQLVLAMAESHASAEDYQKRMATAAKSMGEAITLCQQRAQSTHAAIVPVWSRGGRRNRPYRGGF